MCCISTKRAGGRAIIIVEQASLPPRVHRGCSERRLWASPEKMVVRVHEGNQGRRDQNWISRSAQASICWNNNNKPSNRAHGVTVSFRSATAR